MEKVRFSERLRELRIERGLSQGDLSKEFIVHRTTVKDWEVRGKEPNFLTLCKIAKYFGVSTDYLLGLED